MPYSLANALFGEVWVSLNRASLDYTTWLDGMVGRVGVGEGATLQWLERVEQAVDKLRELE